MRTRRTAKPVVGAADTTVPSKRRANRPADDLQTRKRKREGKQQSPAEWGWSEPTTAAESEWPDAWFDSYCKTDQMRRYMHQEWGFEKRGDQALFEKICLEGALAALVYTALVLSHWFRAHFACSVTLYSYSPLFSLLSPHKH